MKIKKIEVGDKFIVRNKEYIACRIEGLYYFINIDNGGIWTDGLDYGDAVREVNECNFVKVK